MQLAELEAVLRKPPGSIVGTPEEPQFQLMMDAAIDHIKRDCNRDFLNADGELDLPASVKMAVGLLVKSFMENPGVASQSLGELSKSFFEGGTYKAARKLWQPYRKMRYV